MKKLILLFCFPFMTNAQSPSSIGIDFIQFRTFGLNPSPYGKSILPNLFYERSLKKNYAIKASLGYGKASTSFLTKGFDDLNKIVTRDVELEVKKYLVPNPKRVNLYVGISEAIFVNGKKSTPATSFTTNQVKLTFGVPIRLLDKLNLNIQFSPLAHTKTSNGLGEFELLPRLGSKIGIQMLL